MNESGELAEQEWRIIPSGSEEIIYVGKGDSLDDIFKLMKENGENGGYLRFLNERQ